MLHYVGIEVYFRPKAEAREIWLLCSIYEPILQKGKTICCQQNVFLEVHMVIRMSIQTDVLHVVLLYYHPVGTILAEPNYQGNPSFETILSTLNVPTELVGYLSKARF